MPINLRGRLIILRITILQILKLDSVTDQHYVKWDAQHCMFSHS